MSEAAPGSRTPTDVRERLLGGSTYRSLAEQRLTPAEERFERARGTAGFVLAPVLTVGFLLLPLDLSGTQQSLAAVLLGVIALWICESVPIPVGGLIGVGTIILLGVAPSSEVLAPFGSTTVFVFIGAFILAQAMLKHGVAHRIALAILALPGVGTSVVRVVIAFGAVTALLSAFVSNTATVAMLVPTALGLLVVIAELLQKRGDVAVDFDPTRLRVGAALMLMLAYGASIGGLLTPVGSPPNLIGRDLIAQATGTEISFVQWTLTALPICATMGVALVVLLLLLNRPEVRRLEGVAEFVAAERARLGTMTRAERNTVVAFSLTAALWVTPAVISVVLGTDSAAFAWADDRLDEGVVAVLGASLLFVLPVDWSRREFTLEWSDAAKIDWGTILLFGTGIIFGALLSSTGLAEVLGTSSVDVFGVATPTAITAFAIVLAIVISETTSNTASAAVVVPIIIPLAVAAGVDPTVPALAAAFAASFGFMMPVSTPQNAIVYGTGCVPITRMIRSGLAFDIVGGLTILLLLPLVAEVTGII